MIKSKYSSELCSGVFLARKSLRNHWFFKIINYLEDTSQLCYGVIHFLMFKIKILENYFKKL